MKKLLTLIFLFAIGALIINPLVLADQSVTISAIVPPRLSDYQFDFTSDGSPNLSSRATIWYQITYGSTLDALDTPNLTIVADWGNATAPNGADIVDYYMDTATDGYGGVKPVVDLINHTITWTIPNLPAKVKDQTVSFKLLTTSNYSGPAQVNFTVSAKMNNQYFTLPDQSVQKTYQYYQPPAPASAVMPTPAPSVSTTPTPQPVSSTSQNQITHLSVTGTSQQASSFSVTTNSPTELTVRYGTSPLHLTQIVTTQSFSKLSNVSLSDLLPDTTYYFQVTATTPGGQSATSDIFSFKTAKPSVIANLDNSIIVLSSNGSVLSSGVQKQDVNKNPFIILSVNSPYQIAYTLTNPISLRSIEAVVQKNVLAAVSTEPIDDSPETVIPMEQKGPTQYVADLQSLNSGSYTVIVRITDTNGNIFEKKIADLKILPHLTVYAQDTNRPLQDARVSLFYFDTQTKTFRLITPELFGNITNPRYTDSTGQIVTILPPGRYRVEESALFYDKVVKDFTIGQGVDQNFPVIYLKRDPSNLYSLGLFAKDYLADSWSRGVEILNYAASSVRIFHLVSVAILGSFVLLSFLLFLLRSHINFRHLPVYFLFHLHWLMKQHKQNFLFGSVVDEHNAPLSRVRIEVEDSQTQNIITHTYSHNTGKFYLKNTSAGDVSLLVSAEGFEPTRVFVDKASTIPDGGIRILLKKGIQHNISAQLIFFLGLGDILGMLFEVSLVLSIILELLFFSIYGFAKTTPYFLLSLINISLWLFYLRERIERV